MINEFAQYGPAPLELNSDSPAPLELNSESPAPLKLNSESPTPLKPNSDPPAAPSVDRSYDDGVKSVLRVIGDVESVGIARRMLDANDLTGLRFCLDEIERRLAARAAR